MFDPVHESKPAPLPDGTVTVKVSVINDLLTMVERLPILEFERKELVRTLAELSANAEVLRAAVKDAEKRSEEISTHWARILTRMEREQAHESFDLVAYLNRQRKFSLTAFGPGDRAKAIIAHIRKELLEVEEDPDDLVEWLDVAMLALDGAWRSGAPPAAIVSTLNAKLDLNEKRTWPDWRTHPEGVPAEHVK